MAKIGRFLIFVTVAVDSHDSPRLLISGWPDCFGTAPGLKQVSDRVVKRCRRHENRTDPIATDARTVYEPDIFSEVVQDRHALSYGSRSHGGSSQLLLDGITNERSRRRPT
jgi:hypothetical protein